MIGRLLVTLSLLGVLIGYNLRVVRYETTLAGGRQVLVPIGGADPRSIMQGDYWAFNVLADLPEPPAGERRGALVMTVGADDVARFARWGDDAGGGELMIRWYREDGEVKIVPESWFIEEGTADLYVGASFARVSVTPDGTALLVGLTNEERHLLGPVRSRW